MLQRFKHQLTSHSVFSMFSTHFYLTWYSDCVGGNPSTSAERAVMHERTSYMRLPVGWSIYWNLLRMKNKMTIRDAQSLMVVSGYTEFEGDTIFALRQCELYTSGTIVCECTTCHQGLTDHKVPVRILSESYYNDNREKNRSYWK